MPRWAASSGARSRRHPYLERAVRAADDFLAGEAVTLQRIRNQMSLRIVQRQRPESRRRGDAADDHVAAPIEQSLAVIRCRRECHAIAGADRQLAAARDRGGEYGSTSAVPVLGRAVPGADRERAEIRCRASPSPKVAPRRRR